VPAALPALIARQHGEDGDDDRGVRDAGLVAEPIGETAGQLTSKPGRRV
jgi:hypothetical protein